jgi:predicted xylose isomerase-like sugar epimerase
MSELMIFNICGHEIPLSELKEDVSAAKKKGYRGSYAFTPETLEAVIIKLEEVIEENIKLRRKLRKDRN